MRKQTGIRRDRSAGEGRVGAVMWGEGWLASGQRLAGAYGGAEVRSTGRLRRIARGRCSAAFAPRGRPWMTADSSVPAVAVTTAADCGERAGAGSRVPEHRCSRLVDEAVQRWNRRPLAWPRQGVNRSRCAAARIALPPRPDSPAGPQNLIMAGAALLWCSDDVERLPVAARTPW